MLLAFAEFADSQTGGGMYDIALFRQALAQLAAYRQSIEAGAPVAWAVGVDA